MATTEGARNLRSNDRASRDAAKRRNREAPDHDEKPARSRKTLWLGLAGSGLMWAALPPLDLWPLAWVAPVCWLLLVRLRELPGRHPYRDLYIAGFAFWMGVLHWLRLPHWATSFGWVALSLYLAFYIPVFVALARVAVWRLGASLIVAAPVAWTGLELVRGHLLGGFTMASLGHTQYRWIELIQFADLAGAYGVGFLVMLVAACLARMIPLEGRRLAVWPLVPLAASLALALAYGHWRTAVTATRPGPRIALIQGSIDSEMKHDPKLRDRVFREYYDLTAEATKRSEELDLIVWPETMYRDPLLTYTDDASPTPDATWTIRDLTRAAEESRRQLAALAQTLQVPLVLGIDVQHFGPATIDRYNGAIHVTAAGDVADRYDKVHRVMFGEYIPFAKSLPWLYGLTPLTGGIEPGTRDAVFEVDGARMAPNICYESVLPHVIRSQVERLRRRDAEPDVLLNLTNSGWYWGSSELDLHLMCNVFRALECRKPMLVAANTGISASIDAEGRIRARGPRRDKDVLIVDVELDGRRSWYARHGDWFAGACLTACLGLAVVGVSGRLRARRRSG